MPSALLVDDSSDLLDLYALALRMAGWAVETATNVDLAMRSLAANRPDLIVTDLAMPGAGGQELSARARELFRNERIPIVVISGQVQGLRRGEGGPLLKACYVREKPVTPEQLVATATVAVRGCGSRCPGAALLSPDWLVLGCGLLSPGHESPA
jgi:DNA-binding response OmpR family regulator